MPIVILFLLAFDLWYIIKVNKGDVWQVSGDVFSRHTTPDTRHLKNLLKKEVFRRNTNRGEPSFSLCYLYVYFFKTTQAKINLS